jgi:leucyl/phenylalanyl-tRNA--protein transferase
LRGPAHGGYPIDAPVRQGINSLWHTIPMPVFRLTDELVFPPPELAADEGLLALGGDLSVDRVLLGYSMGIFPWYSEGDPLLWWSPDPRMILLPCEFKAPRRLARKIRQGVFDLTMDRAFPTVLERCASIYRPTQDGTWITSDMTEAYLRLYEQGYAHSVECWQSGELAGGLYGVSLGNCFFGESMFSETTDASKVALAALVKHALRTGLTLIDCQLHTPLLKSLGAKEVSRDCFLALLKKAQQAPTRLGRWTLGQGPAGTGHAFSVEPG